MGKKLNLILIIQKSVKQRHKVDRESETNMSMSAQKNGEEMEGREQASEEMIRAQDVINSSGGIFED